MIIELKDEKIKKGAAPGYLEELAGRLWRERIHMPIVFVLSQLYDTAKRLQPQLAAAVSYIFL